MIDVSSEWRDFGNDSDSPSKSRVGAAQSLLYDTANLETIVMGKISSNMSNGSSLPKPINRISQVLFLFQEKKSFHLLIHTAVIDGQSPSNSS